MCSQGDIEETSALGIDNLAIYTLGQNPDVLEPSQYHKNVRMFWWCGKYIHHSGGGNGRAIIPPAEKISASVGDQDSICHAAGMLSGELNSFFENYTQGHKTWEHSPSRCIYHYMKNIIKLCDFGWSVHQDNKLRTTFCGTPLYVCPEILKGR